MTSTLVGTLANMIDEEEKIFLSKKCFSETPLLLRPQLTSRFFENDHEKTTSGADCNWKHYSSEINVVLWSMESMKLK